MSKKLFLSQSLFWGILGWNLCNDCWWCSCIRQTECYNAASVICWVGFRRESRNETWRLHHWCVPISKYLVIPPKREKTAEKWPKKFRINISCKLGITKHRQKGLTRNCSQWHKRAKWDNIESDSCELECASACIRTHAHTTRAHSLASCAFLLSHLSHGKKIVVIKGDEEWKKRRWKRSVLCGQKEYSRDGRTRKMLKH